MADAQKLISSIWPKKDWYISKDTRSYKTPPPSIFNVIDFFCYAKCKKVCDNLEVNNEIVDIALVPLWVCNNEDNENSSKKWMLNMGLVKNEGVNTLDEIKNNVVFAGKIEFVKAPCIIYTKDYHSTALNYLEYNCINYGVLYATVNAIVLDTKIINDVVIDVEKPVIEAPPFSKLIWPALKKYKLPEDLENILEQEFSMKK